MGLLDATGGEVNGRPSFQMEHNANLMLWWAKERWWVGKREELGLPRGWIKAESGALAPDAPGTRWLVEYPGDPGWAHERLML